MKWKILAILVLLLSGVSASWAYDSSDDNYTFGVFPYLSTTRLESIYLPVSIEMSKALGKKVNFRTSTEYRIFFDKLKQQSFDIALIQPFWYPPAADQYNYLPLVRYGEPLTSRIMVLSNSPIKTINDLKGKIIATPPAFVPIVHMAKRALQNHGLNPERDLQLKAFRTVDSCIKQVIIGTASGCVAPNHAHSTIKHKMHISLRPILESLGIPNVSVVVHSRVPPEEREKIKNLLLSWGESGSEAHKKLLHSIGTKGFIQSKNDDYEVVRTLLREINATSN
jgi:phosphonate transport system substrate-binding protein